MPEEPNGSTSKYDTDWLAKAARFVLSNLNCDECITIVMRLSERFGGVHPGHIVHQLHLLANKT
jgi:hypothetical protein